MAILIDTNVLLAVAFSKDINHLKATQLMSGFAGEKRVVPAPVLSELFYLTTVRIDYERAIQVFARTRSAFHIEALTDSDMIRMQKIMQQYRTAKFDFVDVAIMAMSERLNIQRVCTFDRRDFPIFRPAHCDYLELLP